MGSENCTGCGSHGPGYSSPKDAFENGPREKVLFVTCPNVGTPQKPDVIATVDVDPESRTYCQVISKVTLSTVGDEVHHTGWNACSSCYNDSEQKRQYLVVPCLISNRILFIDTSNPSNLRIHKVIEASELLDQNLSCPHTAHCLADGNIMISTIGDDEGLNQGNFALVDGKSLKVTGKWPADGEHAQFGYDYWYQPRCNVMISTEWGVPNKFRKGFNIQDVEEGGYGRTVHIWDWTKRTLKQSITLDPATGILPFEVRFLHEPTKCHAFLCTALGSSIYHLYREKEDEEFKCRLAATIPSKTVKDWHLPMDEMPGLCTDIVLSMDDRFLYISQWLHGDIRQYDISDPFDIKLVGQCFLGGSIHTGTGVKVVADKELSAQPPPLVFDDGKQMAGGPQMLQLSLDGKRLYVTNSLFSVWDKQFYPKMTEKGSMMLQLDVDIEKGGLKLNKNFRVDFSELQDGPYLAHEMRYLGGDCTSDIWV